MRRISIQDIMSEDIVTIDEHATIGQAAHLLLRYRINGILITRKKNKNDVIGIATTTDLLKLLDGVLTRHGHRMSELRRIANLPVIDIASKGIIRAQVTTKIEKVIAFMHKKNKHTIPIYDGAKLAGIAGRHDILNAAFSFLSEHVK